MALFSPSRGRPGVGLWFATNLALLTVAALAATTDWRSGDGATLFAIVVPAAGLCLVTSITVVVVAHRDGNAELGIFGCFFLIASALPFVHALTIPGTLYGPNSATSMTGTLALPLAVAAGLPLVAPRSALSRAVARRWRIWTGSWYAVVAAISAIALTAPRSLPALSTENRGVAFTVIGAGLVLLVIGFRHLRLYWLSRSRWSLAASLGFVVLAHSAPGSALAEAYGLAFWWSHALDVAGVGIATIAAAVSYRQSTNFRETLRPIVSSDPMLALEVGLDPTVHDFIAQLESKDPVTRDHVTRVADISSRVGMRNGLAANELRDIAIGAVLHDIGKLQIPDAILNKPGRLTADEYEVVKTHAAIGADLVASSPALASATAIVRGHHERPDGLGYPDGLAGDAIPLAARIVAVCDAFDAIANTRQYRDGQGPKVALGVLQEHAGTQFDQRVVDTLAEIVESDQVGDVFGNVGRRPGLGGSSPDVLPTAADATRPACPDCERQMSTH